jgi:predicted chitinase
MTAWRDAGQKDLLKEYGLFDSFHGTDTINLAKVMQMILSEAEGESPEQVAESRKAAEALKSRVDSHANRLVDRFTAAAEDVYANGMDSPTIQAVKMQAGHYKDVATGKIIQTTEDITGEVIDVTKNRVVVTTEQAIAGLKTRGGKILRKAQAQARLLRMRNRQHIERASGAVSNVRDRAQQAWQETKNKAKKIYSIYEEGGTVALIDAAKLEAGHYKDVLTGKILETVDDIKGPVLDLRTNRHVLRAEHFAKGLRDEHGHKLVSLGEQVSNSVKTMYQQHIGSRLNPDEVNNPTAGEVTVLADAGPSIASEMSTLVQLNAQQVQLLTGIHEILATRNFLMAPGEGGPMEEAQRKSWLQRIKDMPKDIKRSLINGRKKAWGLLGTGLGKVTKAAAWLGGKFGKGMVEYTKAVGRAGLAIAKAPFRLLGAAADMTDLGYFRDVWVKGGKQPALYAKKMRNGDYIDKATGKVIKSFKDIKGEVLDRSIDPPTIALTQEEYASGLFDTKGRKLSRALLGTAGALARTVFGGYAALVKLPFMLLTGAAKLVGTGFKAAFRQPDVYVRTDMTKPRLRGILLEQGRYFSVKSKKAIFKHQDIDGAIREIDGQQRELISEEEFKEGVVDARGKPLGTFAEKVTGAALRATGWLAQQAGRLARGYAQVMGGIMGFGKDALLGLLGRMGGIFNPKVYTANSKKTNDLLEAIHDMLDDRLPKGEGRSGSWQSQLAARKKSLLGLKSGKDEGDKKNPLGGLFDKLKGGGNNILKMLGLADDEDEGDDGSLLDDAGDAADILDYANGDGNRRGRAKKRLKRMRGKGGMFRRGLRAVKGLGGRLGGKLGLTSLLARFAPALMAGGGATTALGTGAVGTTAAVGTGAAATATGAGALATGAGTAGTVAAGGVLATLGLPLLIGAAVVGAVGYAAYKGFKKYKYGTYTPMRAFRMAQYGVDFSDASQVEKMVEFEQMVEPHVSGNAGRVDIMADGISMEDVYKHFDIDDGWFTNNADERKQFDLWFNQRFKPVFIAWRNATQSFKKGAMNDADDSLKSDQKLQVLKAVNGVGKGVYAVNVGPFGKISIGPKEVQEAYVRATSEVEKEVKNGGKKTFLQRMDRLSVAMVTATMGTTAGHLTQKMLDKRNSLLDKVMGKDEKTGGGGGKGAFVGGGAAKGVKLGGSLSALDAIRYRTYGLVDMDTDKVRALASLEADVLSQLVFNSAGQARFEGDVQRVFESHGPAFGSDYGDWSTWFEKRFLPTLIAFGSAVREFNGSADILSAVKSLKPDQQMVVAQALQSAKSSYALLFSRSVWSISASPWPGYALNSDPRTIHDNLMALKESSKNRVMNEDKGKDAGGKGAKGTASTKGADAAKRQEAQTSFMSRMKDWMFGKDSFASKAWERTKSGVQAAKDQFTAAAGEVREGRYLDAAGSAIAGATAPARHLIGMGPTPPPIRLKGSAKDLEAAVIREARRAGITDKTELAMLLGQLAHESGNFAHREENLKYRPESAFKTFRKYFHSAADAASVLSQGPVAFAEVVYGGRMGNRAPGDGHRYRGRGPIQLTGRDNYAAFAKWSGIDVLSNPDLVASDPKIGAMSAVYWWISRGAGLRKAAQSGDLVRVTKLVNGGSNGLEDRRTKFSHYLKNLDVKLAEAGKDANTVAGKPDFSNVVGGASGPAIGAASTMTTANGTSAAATTGATPELSARERSAAMLAGASGYGSNLDTAANNSIPTPYASSPVPTGIRPAALQDDAIAKQREAAAQAAQINDRRAQLANDDAARQLASVQGLLEEQLKTQQSMDAKLGDIRDVLKSLKGSAIAAAGSSSTGVDNTSTKPTAPARGVRKTEEMPQAPISVRRRSVG